MLMLPARECVGLLEALPVSPHSKGRTVLSQALADAD